MQHFLDLWLVTDVVLGLSLDACCSCFLNQVRFCVFYEKGKGEKIIRSVFPLSYNKQGTTYNQWSRKLLIKQRCNLKKSIFAIKCQRLASAGRKMVPFSPMKGGGEGGADHFTGLLAWETLLQWSLFFFFFFFWLMYWELPLLFHLPFRRVQISSQNHRFLMSSIFFWSTMYQHREHFSVMIKDVSTSLRLN